MATVREYKTKAGEKRYRVRYQTPDRKPTDKRGFKTKREAAAYAVTVEASKQRAEYVAPSAGRRTVSDLGEKRLERRLAMRKPSTMHSEESTWRIRVQPRWGERNVSAIDTEEVELWIAEMAREGLSHTSIGRAHGILSGILDEAVRARRIARNPAAGLEIPKRVQRKRPYLTHAQVRLLADLCSEHEQSLIIKTLAYTGLRWGEVAGLRIENIDRTRARFSIEENAVAVNGHVIVGSPKDHEFRSVPVPRSILDELSERIRNRRADQLLFGDGDAHMLPPSSRDGWMAVAVRHARELD